MEQENLVLTQEYLSWKKTYFIEDDGIYVEFNKLFSNEKYKIQFEHFNPHPKEIKKIPAIWSSFTIITFFAFFISILRNGSIEYFVQYGIFILIFGIISIYKFKLNYHSYIFFNSFPEKIKFIKDKPSVEELDEFLNQLLLKYYDYMNGISIPSARNTKLDSLDRLTKLKEIGSITDDEFNKLKYEILNEGKSIYDLLNNTSLN